MKAAPFAIAVVAFASPICVNAQTVQVKPTDVVALSNLINEVTKEIVAVGQYDIRVSQADQDHCSYEIAARPTSFKISYKQATNVTLTGTLGGTIYILTATGSAAHSNVQTATQTMTQNINLPITSGARTAVLSTGYNDPQISDAANQLRTQIEAQLSAIIGSDHSLPLCIRQPQNIELERDLQVETKLDGTLKVAWLLAVGGDAARTSDATQSITVTYDLKTPFTWTYTPPGGQSYQVPGKSTTESWKPPDVSQ